MRRRNFEEAALFVVQNRGEDARGVEFGEAAPVDGSINSHQSYRMHVADDAIGFDPIVGHLLLD